MKLKNTRYRRLDLVGHTFNPDLSGFKDREGYTVRPHLKKYRVESFFQSETWISFGIRVVYVDCIYGAR